MNNSLLQINIAAETVEEVVTQTEEATELTLSFWELSLKGGWIMLPIVFLSIVAVYIFIERFFAIKEAAKEEKSFMDTIKQNIQDGKIDSAYELCQNTEGPLARMIEKGITRIGKPLEDINTSIENVGKLEIYKLEKNLPMLATAAGAGPMIGFLGTVIGMIRAFYDMSKAGNNIDVSLLSNGIYTAMVTTVAGLIVGIIAYLAYNTLVAKVEKVVYQLEARTSEFIDLLNEPVA